MYEENKHLSREEMQDFIDHLIQSQDESEAELEWDVSKDNLYPRVKTQSEVAIRQLYFRSMGAGDEVADSDLWPLGADLIYELVIDGDVNITTVSNDQITKWGITPDEANMIAIENFNAASMDPSFEEISPGLYRSTWEDNYDASRIMIPDILSKYTIKGDIVTAIPTRDVLMFTGSEDEEGLAAFAELLQEYYGAQRYISFRPYVYHNQHWDFYYPATDHSLYPLFNQLHLSAIKGDYDEQKELLEEVFEKEEHDVFVATYAVMGDEDSNELFSSGTWSEGVPTYLAKTDVVVLVKDVDGDFEAVGFVHWDHMMDKCQHLIKKTEHHPTRIYVEEFPSQAILSELDLDAI